MSYLLIYVVISDCLTLSRLLFRLPLLIFYAIILSNFRGFICNLSCVSVFVSNDFLIIIFFGKKIHMDFEEQKGMSLQYIIEANTPTASTATPASTTAEPATTTPSPAGPGELCNNSEPCVTNAFCSDTVYCQCNDTYYPNSSISCEESEYSSTTS